MARTALAGRVTADAPPGTVAFLIGVRVNRPWKDAAGSVDCRAPGTGP